MQNSEVPCVRYLIGRIVKTYDYINHVDVVERLHDPTDQVPNVRHLRVQHTVSSMTYLELLIQQRVEGEFRQHDGVVMMMMLYRRRASPKHYVNMTRGVNCGGGAAHG